MVVGDVSNGQDTLIGIEWNENSGKRAKTRKVRLLVIIKIGAAIPCTLVVRIGGGELLAVTSCAPFGVLGAFREMLLLAIEAANVALPGLAVVAATRLGLPVDVVGIDRGELAVSVCVGWARHCERAEEGCFAKGVEASSQ